MKKNNTFEKRLARLESIDKENAMLERLIKAIHDVVNDLIDGINNPERQSKLLDMIIHKEDRAINTIIDFIEDETDFSKGYLLSKRSIIADEASEVAGALAIYSDWEDKGYFNDDGDSDESVNRTNKQCKNESSYDISADIFQWFNKRCCDILNNGDTNPRKDGLEDLTYELKYADIGEWTDEVMLDLEANLGYDADALEEQRDQIEYDLEKLINDTLDHIEFGDIDDLEFAKNKSNWIDKYANPDEYTTSLESRVRKLESLVRKMLRK